jgi:hypothetical protein
MKPTAPLIDFLCRLEAAKIHFSLSRIRDETVMVEIAVPGEHWEVEFFADGTIEIERYRSNGKIEDASALKELFERFGDVDPVKKSGVKRSSKTAKRSDDVGTSAPGNRESVSKGR